jgi:hypothetical protein
MEKWKLRDQGAAPKKGALLLLDDESDEEGVRNNGKPEGNNDAKEMIKLEAYASNLASKLMSS